MGQPICGASLHRADLPVALDVGGGDLVNRVDIGRLPHPFQEVIFAQPAPDHRGLIERAVPAEQTVLALDKLRQARMLDADRSRMLVTKDLACVEPN